jgi:hypothetical protein
MIKLLDILNEGEITDVDMHLNDHLKAIIKHAAFALKSNDRKDISESIGEIMKHTTFANDKNQFDHYTPSVFGGEDSPIMSANGSDLKNNM